MGDTTVPVTGRLRAPTFDVLLRPRRSLVRSTVLSIVFSAVPLAVALVWVSLPVRWWALVATLVVVLAVVVGVLFVRLRSAFLGIAADAVVLNGVVSANRRIARDRVDHVVVASTHGSPPDRTVRELLAFDVTGRHLFRMRADVWGDAALDRVVDELDVRVDREPRVVPPAEIARRWPTSRAWYERRSGALVAALAAVVLVVGLLAVETVRLLAA
ncbi:hypothetical protein [Curtobacterium sp. MCBA15_012]|uniref:hypothetical protein n=1 Tax=Curtobacterium sp. MCBA15_012 TaxID=1898738 RepID=UPI000A73D40B|nr:hypothetical protein [Curtobacterium sp. MCBA15_012]WIA99101.1 hypothetical protein QOL15_11225 [Curtobacterium sp. MCBA15_012]